MQDSPDYRITGVDFAWLDDWEPPQYLTAEGSEDSWIYIRDVIEKYECNADSINFVQYWLKNYDANSINRVSWSSFERNSLAILRGKDGLSKDDIEYLVASAWNFLDDSQDGSISITEVDLAAGEALLKFREWCKSNFESVHRCFCTLDVDHSGEVSFATFRTAIKRWEGLTIDDLNALISLFTVASNPDLLMLGGGHGHRPSSRQAGHHAGHGHHGNASKSKRLPSISKRKGSKETKKAQSGSKISFTYEDLAFLDAWDDADDEDRHTVILDNVDYFTKTRLKRENYSYNKSEAFCKFVYNCTADKVLKPYDFGTALGKRKKSPRAMQQATLGYTVEEDENASPVLGSSPWRRTSTRKSKTRRSERSPFKNFDMNEMALDTATDADADEDNGAGTLSPTGRRSMRSPLGNACSTPLGNMKLLQSIPMSSIAVLGSGASMSPTMMQATSGTMSLSGSPTYAGAGRLSGRGSDVGSATSMSQAAFKTVDEKIREGEQQQFLERAQFVAKQAQNSLSSEAKAAASEALAALADIDLDHKESFYGIWDEEQSEGDTLVDESEEERQKWKETTENLIRTLSPEQKRFKLHYCTGFNDLCDAERWINGQYNLNGQSLRWREELAEAKKGLWDPSRYSNQHSLFSSTQSRFGFRPIYKTKINRVQYVAEFELLEKQRRKWGVVPTHDNEMAQYGYGSQAHSNQNKPWQQGQQHGVGGPGKHGGGGGGYQPSYGPGHPGHSSVSTTARDSMSSRGSTGSMSRLDTPEAFSLSRGRLYSATPFGSKTKQFAEFGMEPWWERQSRRKGFAKGFSVGQVSNSRWSFCGRQRTAPGTIGMDNMGNAVHTPNGRFNEQGQPIIAFRGARNAYSTGTSKMTVPPWDEGGRDRFYSQSTKKKPRSRPSTTSLVVEKRPGTGNSAWNQPLPLKPGSAAVNADQAPPSVKKVRSMKKGEPMAKPGEELFPAPENLIDINGEQYNPIGVGKIDGTDGTAQTSLIVTSMVSGILGIGVDSGAHEGVIVVKTNSERPSDDAGGNDSDVIVVVNIRLAWMFFFARCE